MEVVGGKVPPYLQLVGWWVEWLVGGLVGWLIGWLCFRLSEQGVLEPNQLQQVWGGMILTAAAWAK